MKMPGLKPFVMKAMPLPTSGAERVGQAEISDITSYAYHPPQTSPGMLKLQRPKGGKGPRNPKE